MKDEVRTEPTKIAIVGYGNVGRGVKLACERNLAIHGDTILRAIISRDPVRTERRLKEDKTLYPIFHFYDSKAWSDLGIDVAILCGGSKTDLPWQGPFFAHHFNTVDSFDNHNYIPSYFDIMNLSSQPAEHTAVTSAGWDPGKFSVERVLGEAFIPGATGKGFYGLTEKGGLSQGHPDAVRRIKGVKDARQYTHAIPMAIEVAQSGADMQNFGKGDMHWREVFVILEQDTPEERTRVEEAIKTDPDYFAPYKTTVNFVKEGELSNEMPHDGVVISSGTTGKGNDALIEYKNVWASNPEATGNILVACARACHRMNLEKKFGAFTMLDIPAAQLSPYSQAKLLEERM